MSLNSPGWETSSLISFFPNYRQKGKQFSAGLAFGRVGRTSKAGPLGDFSGVSRPVTLFPRSSIGSGRLPRGFVLGWLLTRASGSGGDGSLLNGGEATPGCAVLIDLFGWL